MTKQLKAPVNPGVHATFYDAVSTPDDFLKQAHPAPAPLPILTQRQHFHRLTQPTERGTFFLNKNKTGTSTIGKNNKEEGNP